MPGVGTFVRADRRQAAITALCGLLFLAWCALVLRNAHIQNGDVLGDWIMDYSQGFVRRGLIGSVLSRLSALSGLPLTLWVPAVQIALYGCFLFFWLRVLAGRHKPFWYVLLVCSPVTLLFSYFGSAEVGRKEVLHFAMLAVFVWTLDRRRSGGGWALLLVLMSVVATLSHELVVFYTPYYLMAAAMAPEPCRRRAMMTAGAIVLSSMCAALSVLLLAHPLDGQAMCASFMQAGYSGSVCKGIILWPVQSVRANVDSTIEVVQYFNYFALYPPALLVGLAPIFLWLRRYPGGAVKRHLIWFALAALVSLPAFVLAVDWGRFIQIHLMSAMLILTLCLRRRSDEDGGTGPGATAPASEPRIRNWPHPAVACTAAIVCLSLALVWHMPNCCVSDMGSGVLGKAGEAARYVLRVTGR